MRKALNELWDQAPDGTLIFPSHQTTNAALTDKLQRICRKAGIALWEKPWGNMRSTRETELTREWPIHEVTEWLGNSPSIALKHYNQVFKEQAARAATRADLTPADVKN
jgi:hypothetical protein